LSNTNENTTIHILQKILEVNKALTPKKRTSKDPWPFLKKRGKDPGPILVREEQN